MTLPEYIPASVAVVGAGGMLGRDVVRELQRRQIVCHALERQECDIRSLSICEDVLVSLRPDVVINCSGYTNVNKAESDPDAAYLVNAHGARNLAQVCADINAKLISVSTDYVFDGESDRPYEVDDRPNPINVYGRSKLGGEKAIAEIMPAGHWTVVRTSWLFGIHGNNFVKSMLKLARDGQPIKVVNDQVGSPTYSLDLASVLADLPARPASGIVHVTASGFCTWFEFAQAIFQFTGIQPFSLEPLATADFPTPARRPLNNRLSPASSIKAGAGPLPDWRDGLRRYLQETGELKV